MATNEEKSPLVKEIAAAGAPLDDNYFIDAENLELWLADDQPRLVNVTVETAAVGGVV